MRADRVGDRLEPAFDPAIQRVVVAALVMRLMRFARDRLPRGAKTGKAAAAIAPAIGHVHIDAEIVPTRRETVPIAQPGRFEQRAHFRGADERIPVAADGFGDGGEVIGHRLDFNTGRQRRAAPFCAMSALQHSQGRSEAGFSLMQRSSRQ